VLTGNPIRQLG